MLRELQCESGAVAESVYLCDFGLWDDNYGIVVFGEELGMVQ